MLVLRMMNLNMAMIAILKPLDNRRPCGPAAFGPCDLAAERDRSQVRGACTDDNLVHLKTAGQPRRRRFDE